jgi:dephospho-CoA kinase
MASKTPLVVGLTGGIGSGKSAAAKRFAQHGIAVIDTDIISRALTAANGAAMPAIKQQFGAEFVRADGALNRDLMREKVFSDPAAKRKLEAILHPMIRAESISRIQQAKSPYVILAVPLLFETDGYKNLINNTLVIDCAEETQIQRVRARSGMTQEQVRAVIEAQIPRLARLKKADEVINNNGLLDELVQQVDKLHKKYLALAALLSQG